MIHAFIAIISLVLIFATGIFLYLAAINLTQLITKRTVNPRSLLRDFDQKMWMTIGLGVVFFGLYVLIILTGSTLDFESKLALLSLVQDNPTLFIYLGLLIFALLSTAIYLARMVIKHLYNRR